MPVERAEKALNVGGQIQGRGDMAEAYISTVYGVGLSLVLISILSPINTSGWKQKEQVTCLVSVVGRATTSSSCRP